MQGGIGQVEQELVEQRGADGIQGIVARPLGQLFHPFALLRVADPFTQHRQQRREHARAVGGGGAQLQFLGAFQVPLRLLVAELAVELLAAVGEVVVSGDLDAAGWHWLEVGGNDVAPCRVFFLRVAAERIETFLFRLRAAAVEDEAGLHAGRPLGQLRGGPPTDIALGVGPHHVQPGGVDLGRSAAGLGEGVGAVELVKGVEDRVTTFQEPPPHGDRCLAGVRAQGIVDDRTVGRLAQHQRHGCLALDRDLLLAAGHVHPFAAIPDLLGIVRVDLLGDQVQVVVLEHGDAPAEIPVHAQRRKG